MLKHLKLTATCLLLALLNLSAYGAEQPTMAEVARNVVSRLKTQITSFPQEKIYLHLDKPYYAVGDCIWFRAHVVHAALGLPYELSRYIYVELIDSKNAVITRTKIRPIDRMYYGQFSLSTDLQEGWYSIRAYTKYLRNTDESFFYRRQLYIGNSLKDQEKALKDTYSKSIESSKANPFQVSFFPEGGSLLPGNLQKIGIKSTHADGTPAVISGKLVDATNNEVGSFTTNRGLGLIHLVPEEGQRYEAVYQDEQGNSQKVAIPSVLTNAYSLGVVQNQSAIQISLNTADGSMPKDSLLMLVHQRGVPLYQNYFTADKKELGLIKKGIPAGILQFVLIDRGYNVLSERQIFIQQQDCVQVTVTTDKPSYRRRERVSATIHLADATGKPITGNFSISITDDNDVIYNEYDETIESRLLLQSDVSDMIHQPAYYLDGKNKQASSDLDILMLTSSWERYNVASAIKGNLLKGDIFPLERGTSISGQVVSYPSKRGLSGSQVSLFVQNSNHIDNKTTDKNGRFLFDGFEFPDSTKIMLEAKMASTNFIRLLVDNDTFPEVRLSIPVAYDAGITTNVKKIMEKSRERYYQENGVRTINLKEVEVVAQRQEQEKLKRYRLDRGVLYFNPTQTIKQDKLETANTLIDLLITVPGMTVSADGRSVLLNNKTPMIMVDNIKRDMNELSILMPSDVELIDIIKDPADLASYGYNGSNGIIFIHLKRGETLAYSKEPEANQAIIQPLGFCKPLPFPEPNYFKSEIMLSGVPDVRSTLYWKPNVVCDSNGNATVRFFMGDGQGPCTLTIEGVGPDGKIIRYQGKINTGK